MRYLDTFTQQWYEHSKLYTMRVQLQYKRPRRVQLTQLAKYRWTSEVHYIRHYSIFER
jgi:hypothetical protein